MIERTACGEHDDQNQKTDGGISEMKSELEVIAFDADCAEAQSGHDHPEAPVKACAFAGIFAWPEQSCGNQA